MYPRFRAGTYAYVGVGVATQADLYPTYRIGFDLYQSLPWAFEVSAGYRRLEFSNPTDIVVGSISKYLGNWMLTARVYHVPAPGGTDSTSYFGSVRRYFGEAGTSFVGLRYGHGLAREEVRNASDLVSLDSDSLTVQIDTELWRRFRLAFSTGFSHQERANRAALWQLTFGTSLGIRF
jgi:YaiO family outer membrane protein